jgi:hypothetical protein
MLNKITRDFIKKGYFDTLSDISVDDSDDKNPISFFQSSKKYINFDGKVVKNLFKEKELKGCDLLACKDNTIYLVEFKNSTRRQLNKNQKAALKHRTSENSKAKINEHLEKKGEIHFGLERYQNFYDKIITVDKDTYLKKYNHFEEWH